ncbi:MAG TPA: LacI family DNA-binding transcriptional regulator [Catenuloplanes sp.]|jgi:LacI family transcriptional regulator
MGRRAADTSAGPRRCTIGDVAKRAGVSVATVSRVLGGSYPATPATRSRVLIAVRELDYVANVHARALAGATTRTIGIVVNSVVSPYYAHVAQGVQAQAAREGRLCLIGTTDGDPERELATVGLMREQRADAVVLVGDVVSDDDYRARMGQYARSLAAVGSRLVLCGRQPLDDQVPAVVVECDNTGGAYAITSHLLSAGHQRILYLGRHIGYRTADGRVDGYRRALAAHGVRHDPGLEMDGRFERQEGYRMVNQRLAAGPADFTAIFGGNDQIASGARQALAEHGLRVPQDISLVGYDDLPPAADIGLTTVHQPLGELGRRGVRLALRGATDSGAAHLMLGTHVVVRDSVRPR